MKAQSVASMFTKLQRAAQGAAPAADAPAGAAVVQGAAATRLSPVAQRELAKVAAARAEIQAAKDREAQRDTQSRIEADAHIAQRESERRRREALAAQWITDPAPGAAASDAATEPLQLSLIDGLAMADTPPSNSVETPAQSRAKAAEAAARLLGVPVAGAAMAMGRVPEHAGAQPAPVVTQDDANHAQRGLDLESPEALAERQRAQEQARNPDAALVRGRVVAIRYEVVEDDFYIFQVQPEGTYSSRDRVSAKGHGLDLKIDMEVEVRGTWKIDPKYGRQIDGALVSELMPYSITGIRRLLEHGFVRGIGRELADKLLRRFGVRLFEVAERSPRQLLEVDGLGAKKADAFHRAIKEKQAVPRIMAFFSEVGLGPKMSHRAYRALGADAINVIKKNPYALTEVNMFGFSTADGVARAMGVPFDSETRIKACMEAVLEQCGNSGSTAMTVDKLKAAMVKMLAIERDGQVLRIDQARVDAVVDAELQAQDRIVVRELKVRGEMPAKSGESGAAANDGNASDAITTVSLKKLANDEKRIAFHLHRLSSTGAWPALQNVDFSHARFAHLGPDQLEAARRSMKSPVSVITGGPGCGKTTVTKSMIEAMEAVGLRVMLIAPTGRAAQRMSEATGRKASTVHRALKSQGAGKFGHDENNPLDADVIFCDEFSMMPTTLTERLLRAVRGRTQLVLIGDKEQLPSIDPGAVLSDIIRSHVIPVSVLTQIHRQAAGGITANAQRVVSGEVPRPPGPDMKQDFEMVDVREPEKQVDAVLNAYAELRRRGFKACDIQILTPMRKGSDPLGSNALNALLKEEINPASRHPANSSIEMKHLVFSVGDRVMQMANNRDLDIYNGDVGYITELDKRGKNLVIEFNGEPVEMGVHDLEDVDLSYATTIHKSQGSEYKAVIIPISRSHYMLDRSLLYTAQSRGKDRVVLVGDMSVLHRVVARNESSKRVTGLRDELEATFGPALRDELEARFGPALRAGADARGQQSAAPVASPVVSRVQQLQQAQQGRPAPVDRGHSPSGGATTPFRPISDVAPKTGGLPPAKPPVPAAARSPAAPRPSPRRRASAAAEPDASADPDAAAQEAAKKAARAAATKLYFIRKARMSRS